jgi:hypothetical protein
MIQLSNPTRDCTQATADMVMPAARNPDSTALVRLAKSMTELLTVCLLGLDRGSPDATETQPQILSSE